MAYPLFEREKAQLRAIVEKIETPGSVEYNQYWRAYDKIYELITDFDGAF